MMYRCLDCGEIFREPDVRRYTENLDREQGWWTCCTSVCPNCGSDAIEDYDEEEDL